VANFHRRLRLTVGTPPTHVLTAVLHDDLAPRTCAALRDLLPLKATILQARWSGQASWIPLGELQTGLGYENHTSHPAPGEILLYPGGISETEILLPYGATLFASKLGQLAGNHFATILDNRVALTDVGELIWRHGGQDILVEEI
jgi:hypothetical protein